MTVGELYEKLDGLIDKELSCDWDNDGDMCIPSPEREADTVLIALDPSKKAIDEAVKIGASLIITHHPLIFKPIKKISAGEAISDKIITLIKHDVALFSFHTRLDALEGGVNDTLCELIGLENTEKFGPDGEKIGRIGNLSAPISAEELAVNLRDRLGAASVELCSYEKEVSRIAVVGGDGGDFLNSAVSAGADLYITGSMGYNKQNEAAERKIGVITAGHFFTEAPVCNKIADMLHRISPKIKTIIFSSNEIKTV